MAVDLVTERWSGPQAQSESQDGKEGSYRTRRVFDVTVDDPVNDTEETALFATGVPRVRDPHPLSSFLRCVSVSARRASPILWEVDCQYSIPTRDPRRSPLAEPAKISFRSATTEQAIDEDVNGAPLVNVNGEAYDPPLSEPVSDLMMVVTRNQAEFNAIYYQGFKNRVNSDTFLGWPAGTARCVDIEADSVSDEDFQYWTVTYTFHFRGQDRMSSIGRAWWRRIRNEGYLVRADADGTPNASASPRPKMHDQGEVSPVPVLLKTNGTEETNPASAVWNEHQTKRTAALSALLI